jgi:hypothetical protein
MNYVILSEAKDIRLILIPINPLSKILFPFLMGHCLNLSVGRIELFATKLL